MGNSSVRNGDDGSYYMKWYSQSFWGSNPSILSAEEFSLEYNGEKLSVYLPAYVCVCSPLRVNRRNVDAGWDAEGEGGRPDHPVIVRGSRPLCLSPRQWGQLQVPGETPASPA